MMFFNKLIIGLRYLLMVYPLIFVFIAPLLATKRRVWQTGIAFLLFWYISGSIKIAPFYLAFANETVGGPKNLWKYVSDSSLDWNQDQIIVEKYKKNHPEITIINPHQPVVGKILVNVNDMNLYYFQNYEWLRKLHKEPVEEVGYTWLVFEITPENIIKSN